MTLQEPILKITMFGDFEYESGEHSITEALDHSKKMRNLLAYLILNQGKNVSYEELIDVIWPDAKINSPTSALKTLLYRLRSIMNENGLPHSQECIQSQKGSYRWNTQIPCEVDVFEFEQLCRSASSSMPDETQIYILTDALPLYCGELLPGSSSDAWVTSMRTYYRSLYLRCAHQLVRLQHKKKNFAAAADVCHQALLVDRFDEQLHIGLIQALLAQFKNRDALMHYKYVTSLFYDELGMAPSSEFTSLYRKISNTRNNIQMDLGIIHGELKESAMVNGAFSCEFEFFKEIYRLKSRDAVRANLTLQLALFSVTDQTSRYISVQRLSQIMSQLTTVIQSNLRRGDVFSRYSSTQFLFLLTCTGFASNENVAMERIIKEFYRQHPKSTAVFQYKILTLDPLSSRLTDDE